jgi:small subunit ribosomal protein S9
VSGQAEALQLALARALDQINGDFHSVLKAEKMLTRDPRMVERKKFGQRKARRRFQFSKR